MKIEFKRINDAYLMEAVNENGNTTLTDGSPDIGGSNLAMRPMQLMLVGLGSCSSIDVIHLLQKQRQDLRDIQLSVTAEREEGVSVEKYCSVGKLLEKTADITWDFEIIPVEEEIQN